MASLVADYGTSSGSDSDSEESTTKSDKQPACSFVAVNFLESTSVDDNDSDSNDPTSNEDASKRADTEPDAASLQSNPLTTPSKLPSPALGGDMRPETSVFVTSFHRAEEAKSSILEQHVKMTDSDLPAEVGGKKICWNFRKGKCRFGYKCRFSHGAEIRGHMGQGAANGLEEAEVSTSSSSSSSTSSSQALPQHAGHRQFHGRGHQRHAAQDHQQAHSGQAPPGHSHAQGHLPYMAKGYRGHQWPEGGGDAGLDEDDYLSNAKRKKRIGVTDTMVPPKRAMRDFDRFRSEERPWTVHQ